MPQPRLLLLGGFDLVDVTGAPVRLTARKSRALLAFLATLSEPQPRDRLAALLWEDSDAEQARSSLRQALSGLRKTLSEMGLGDRALAADSEIVSLDAGTLFVDVSVFRRAAGGSDRAELERALTLYRGELLAAFDARSAAYDEWLREQRSELHRLAVGAADRLVELASAAGDVPAALAAGRRLSALEPLDEKTARGLMQLEASRGHHAEAMEEYRRLRQVLRRDLQLAPEPATEALYQEILQRRRAPLPAEPEEKSAALEVSNPADTSREAAVLAVRLGVLGDGTAGLDPEEAARLAAELQKWVAAQVTGLGGLTAAPVGADVLVAFGATRSRGNEQEAAVRAALALADRGDGSTGQPSWSPAVQRSLRLGLAAGPLALPRTTSGAGPLLVGGPVSRALALAAAAPAGAILAGAELGRGLGSRLEAETWSGAEPGALRVKSLASGLTRAGSGQAGVEGPLAGRAVELAQVRALLERVRQSGCGGVLVVRGEPGIGKSRLARAMVEESLGAGFTVQVAQALDFGQDAARGLIPALTLGLLGLPGDLPPAARSAAVAAAVAVAGARAELISLLELAQSPWPPELEALAGAMDASTRQQGRSRAFGALLRRAAGATPVLLLVEDVQWATAEELSLLAEAARATVESPVLMVLSTRAQGDPLGPAWRGACRGCSVTTLDLGALSADDSRSLAGRFPGIEPSVLEACLSRAEGHPLFLEQLLRAAASGRHELPGTIRALVLARLEALAPGPREALLAAAVLGQRSPAAAVAFVAEGRGASDGSQSGGELSALAEAGLTRSEGEDVVFSHALIRDAVHQSLLGSSRRRLHLRAASWFQQRDARLAAEHLAAADDDGAAAAFLAAARAEAAAHRLESALTCAVRARELSREPAAVAEASALQADLALQLGRVNEALAAYREALEFSPDEGRRAEAELGVAGALRVLDRHDEALEVLVGAERRLLSTDADPAALSRLWSLRGNIHFPRGDLDACLSAHDEARRQAVRAGSALGELAAVGGLGDAYYQRGNMLAAQRCFSECVQGARKLQQLGLLLSYLPMLALTRVYQLDFETAWRECQEALSLSARVSRPRAELVTLVASATVREYGGHAQAALELAERALSLSRQVGAPRFESEALGITGVSLHSLGRRSHALDRLREAWRLTQRSGVAYCGPFVLGALAAATDDAAERERALAEGMSILERGSLAHNALDFHSRALETRLREGEWAAARQHADALESCTAEEPLPWASLMARRGRALAAVGAAGGCPPALRPELSALVGELERRGLSHLAVPLAAAGRSVAPGG